jgi:hypothetical protein
MIADEINQEKFPASNIYIDDPVDHLSVVLMEFRLAYLGDSLKSASQHRHRAWEKHQIRRYFHEQLKNLWEIHPVLNFYKQDLHVQSGGFVDYPVEHHTTIETIAKRWEGYVPVVNGDFGMFCDLDVLYLRHERAGNILQRDDSGRADIDNRMKTLFDALRIPQRGEIQLKENDPPDQSPMYVLLSDDSLVTSLKVTTDRLLTTWTNDPDPADACLIIHVNVRIPDPMAAPYRMTI